MRYSYIYLGIKVNTSILYICIYIYIISTLSIPAAVMNTLYVVIAGARELLYFAKSRLVLLLNRKICFK